MADDQTQPTNSNSNKLVAIREITNKAIFTQKVSLSWVIKLKFRQTIPASNSSRTQLTQTNLNKTLKLIMLHRWL